MTKQEVYDRFYLSLSPDEREAGPEGLPDFVVHIAKEQRKLTRAQLDWAVMVVDDVTNKT